MASIERTAYPRFKTNPTAAEADGLYTPTAAEADFLAAGARGPSSLLCLAVLLKAFQRLGYFPPVGSVPPVVVDHLRSFLRVDPDVRPDITSRTLYRHHQAVRAYLSVEAWGPTGRHIALRAAATAAEVMNNPGDLINVAIEELVRQRHELPAFSTLDRMAGRTRAVVNRRLFTTVDNRLSPGVVKSLDAMLVVAPRQRRSAYNDLKALPKRPTVGHLGVLVDHLVWLDNLGDMAPLLAGVPTAKVVHFAAEAKALDSAELGDVSPPKRNTLLLCLVARAQVQARDDLAEMFTKRMATINKRAKDELADIREDHRTKTEALVGVLADMLAALEDAPFDAEAGRLVKDVVEPAGGTAALLADCEAVSAFHGNNHLPLMWRHYRSHRPTLFRLARTLTLTAASQDRTLIAALEVLLDNEGKRGDWLDADVDLSFASEAWRRTITAHHHGGVTTMLRRHFEVCVFACLAAELRSGDVAVAGSDAYADYRDQLLPWSACEPQVAAYAAALGRADTAEGFVAELRSWLTRTAEEVDAGYPTNDQVVISDDGEAVIKRPARREPRPSAKALEAAVLERLPERNILDVLFNVAHWTGWPRHMGPLSGSDPKLEDPFSRYVLTTFTYGCNLGPVQAARHLNGVSAHMLGFANRRHVDGARQDAAMRDIINVYHRCALTGMWGDPARAGADGTKYDLSGQSLIAEYHIRYGGYGGIAYHHISDTYVALFSHFINAGVWEAVYIIEGLLANTSDIQPDTLHADTQGQSTPVFGLAYLLGIKLMPRIRNWKDLRFYRPTRDTRYRHIDPLLSEVTDWDRIATHCQDLLRVVFSIKAGVISSPVLLRKLGTYSHKNRLYQAFRELGNVVRTVFLLQMLAEQNLREQITVTTNKVEAYQGFSKWCYFGGEGPTMAEDDPVEMEKRIKYNDLVANSAALHNVVDISNALRQLIAEGHPVNADDVASLSPYVTRTIKRFGDYAIPAGDPPEPFDGELVLPSPNTETDR